ncbi:MAG TPA: hypothetical protein VHM70_25500 [Polyangiaceae bacterium]|nr:hypothetical protein [Polyangiaceae bacterium]
MNSSHTLWAAALLALSPTACVVVPDAHRRPLTERPDIDAASEPSQMHDAADRGGPGIIAEAARPTLPAQSVESAEPVTRPRPGTPQASPSEHRLKDAGVSASASNSDSPDAGLGGDSPMPITSQRPAVRDASTPSGALELDASFEAAGDAATPTTGTGAVPTEDPLHAAERCTSGRLRDPNESESAEMMPGYACTSCHAAANAASGEGDAPIFAFAGTLFPTAHEPDGCIGSGAEGARVTVTGADGQMFTASANAAGNFSFETLALVLPYTAKLEFEGRERTMLLSQVNGDCNACHTQAGVQGAPGRMVLP